MSEFRILLVAENVSARFGGEAFLPLHYFRVLRSRGLDVYLLTHERVRPELEEVFPGEAERIFYVPDTPLQVGLWQMGKVLPQSINDVTLGSFRQGVLQKALRKKAREIVSEKHVNVVHQPAPVSPRKPSGLYDLGAPVVIGPLNGNMTLPSGFADFLGNSHRAAHFLGRRGAEVANRLSPGKIKAKTLLVANQRTREGLPTCTAKVRTLELVENGVDMSRFEWTPREHSSGEVHFAFIGRLVDWKATNLLLDAFSRLPDELSVKLSIIGDGPERAELEQQARRLSLESRVDFLGFVPQLQVATLLDCVDVLVLPSLYECGGAVVLEAMAKGIACIATNWGGPADYLDESCGILVEPTDPVSFVGDLSAAMSELANDGSRRKSLGDAGRAKVERIYDWERKVDRILEIYDEAILSK